MCRLDLFNSKRGKRVYVDHLIHAKSSRRSKRRTREKERLPAPVPSKSERVRQWPLICACRLQQIRHSEIIAQQGCVILDVSELPTCRYRQIRHSGTLAGGMSHPFRVGFPARVNLGSTSRYFCPDSFVWAILFSASEFGSGQRNSRRR